MLFHCQAMLLVAEKRLVSREWLVTGQCPVLSRNNTCVATMETWEQYLYSLPKGRIHESNLETVHWGQRRWRQ